MAEFEKNWAKYPAIGKVWREQWGTGDPIFAVPAELHWVVCKANAGSGCVVICAGWSRHAARLPETKAVLTLLYLAIIKTAAQWHTVQNWKLTLNYLEGTAGIACAVHSAPDSRNYANPLAVWSRSTGPEPLIAYSLRQNGVRSQDDAAPRSEVSRASESFCQN